MTCLRAILAAALTAFVAGDEPPQTGPETEKRFPPLKVPAGFKATLFACDPLIEYPSAIALGPKPGSLFVAVDYMTGLGTEIERRDEIRLIEDTDGDGYADQATLYAEGFNSIEGMTFHDGVVYAMHSPLLTALEDMNGDGVADERRDLLTGLGLPPEENPPRLHCANGIVWGYDGWLYLALGDHGCNVPRPEGDRLVLEGGGILRCRPDGRDLHVFATGLRNIYDVALDEDLNVFVRDNENDGGDYKIRVCHSFFGADHGYPYLYSERPDEALPPLADLALGSSAGGLVYLERQFPAEYRGNLFFCEWGRAVVRYVPQRAGSSFAPLQEIDFAAGADNDPYGFKPTDLVVERDGSLVVADWADGQRPRRGRGRIYRIRYAGEEKTGHAESSNTREFLRDDPSPHPLSPKGRGDVRELLAQLDSVSYFDRFAAQLTIERGGADAIESVQAALRRGQLGVRARMHAVWTVAHVRADRRDKPSGSRAAGFTPADDAVITDLLYVARHDPDARVRVQAIRALADLADPALAQHRLDAQTGDARVARQLAQLADGGDSRVILESIVAVGRLRWVDAPVWINSVLRESDDALSHAAMLALRRASNWPAVLKLLDGRDTDPAQIVALRAIAGQFDATIVDELMNRVSIENEPNPEQRRQHADVLTRVYKKPGPWVYWGYRPPPRPPNTVAWERTDEIERTLNRTLLDPDRTVRLATLRRMVREKIPAHPDTLAEWLAHEREAERVAAILDCLKEQPTAEARPLLLAIAGEPEHTVANRLAALAAAARGFDERTEGCLTELAAALEDGPVLAALLTETGRRPNLHAGPLLMRKLNSREAAVRAAAAESLGDLRWAGAGEAVRPLLDDRDASVRRAAASAVGKLQVAAAIEPLWKLAGDGDASVRRASLNSLRLLGEPRVLPLAIRAAQDPETTREAIACIGAFGTPEHAPLVADAAKRISSAEILLEAIGVLTRWGKTNGLSSDARRGIGRAVAELQGSSGVAAAWMCLGPLSAEAARDVAEKTGRPEHPLADTAGASAVWHDELPLPHDPNFTVRLLSSADAAPTDFWIAASDVQITEASDVQFLASSGGTLRVWLNGRPVYERAQAGAYRPESDRFDATLAQGANRLVVQVSSVQACPVQFQVRFRRKSSRAEQEQLVQAALTRPGNAERGRKLFFDAEKSLCIKCHRIGEQGERFGPELTGVGARFSRAHLIESILEPSRTIAPSFESIAVALSDGRILTGLKVSETDTTLTLADNEARQHVLDKSAIDERRSQPSSIMPDGLEKRLTADEFVDLIAFLASQTHRP